MFNSCEAQWDSLTLSQFIKVMSLLFVPTISDGFEYWLGKCFTETVIKFSHSWGNQIFIC